MSYSTMVYQVDSEKIEKLWGSKNTSFLDAFMVKHKDDIEEQADWFEVEPQIYQDCLADIINGTITKDKEYNHIYGYLYQMMCLDFGEQIERDDFLSYLSEVTDGGFKVFIPIPTPNDWPDIYSVKFNDLEKSKYLFLNAAPDYILEDTTYTDEVKYVFKTAQDNKKDLVFINH